MISENTKRNTSHLSVLTYPGKFHEAILEQLVILRYYRMSHSLTTMSVDNPQELPF